MNAVEKAIKKFADEESKAMDRRDLCITIEVTYDWDNEKQKYKDTLKYQVFAYRNRENCPPGATIMQALKEARATIDTKYARLITVCDNCRRASCWQGIGKHLCEK